MGAKLQALFALQDLELQIVDIRRQLGRKQRQVRAQQKRLGATRDTTEAERDAIRRSQIEFDGLDVEIKGRSANVARLREHLNTVRTNKDYAAVLAKLNNEKADVSRLESRALTLMQTIETRKQEFVKREQAAAAEVERLNDLTAQLDQAQRSLGSRLEQLRKQRDQAAAQLDGEILTQFDRLSERYDGEVLAEVEQPNPRRDEYICSGCHMALRIEVANTLRSRDEIVPCQNCGRILFMHRET